MARNRDPRDIGEKYRKAFPSHLSKLMKDRGVTQEDIAKAVGKTRQTVSQYVNGISEPSYEALVKIADRFNVSTDYLLGRTNDPIRQPCAADELSLSTKAVNNIIEYGAMNSSEEVLIGLNLLLESKSFYQVAMKLGYLHHWIVSEERRISNRLNNEYDPNGDDAGLSPDAYSEISDMDLQEALLSELLNNHPELQDHIKLLIGRSAADAQINEINTLFDFLVRKISGYYDLIPD